MSQRPSAARITLAAAIYSLLPPPAEEGVNVAALIALLPATLPHLGIHTVRAALTTLVDAGLITKTQRGPHGAVSYRRVGDLLDAGAFASRLWPQCARAPASSPVSQCLAFSISVLAHLLAVDGIAVSRQHEPAAPDKAKKRRFEPGEAMPRIQMDVGAWTKDAAGNLTRLITAATAMAEAA